MGHRIFMIIDGLLFMTSALCQQPATTAPRSVVEQHHYASEILDRDVTYHMYLPAGYEATHAYPVVYLLHGHGGDADDWIEPAEGNVRYILDSLTREQLIPPVVAVTMDAGNSWYIDRVEHMESAYVREFIPMIESNYLLDARRIIAGNSAGGYGALRFVLRYPEMFRAAILLSPAAYYPVPPAISSSRKIAAFQFDGAFSENVWQQFAYPNLPMQEKEYPRCFLSTGDDDPYEIVRVVTDLRSFMIAHDIARQLSIIDGGHTWEVWRDRFAHDLVRVFDGE